MLHIHNGDSTADTAKQSDLPGEHFAFREALIEGPTPAGLDAKEWRRVRAQHLSDAYEPALEQTEQELREQESKLATFAAHDEVVLWFEHDLFCQINLLYLLDWFSQQELGQTKLSLVCIDQFPGVADFRGLGQLNAAQLASLFPGRKEITRAEMNRGSSAWQAYCSPNPTAIEEILAKDTSALPFLRAALFAHLRRFPSVKNGLGAIENSALELIKNGAKDFPDLFSRFGAALPIYGLGDAQFWLALMRMTLAKQPLVTTVGVIGDDQADASTHGSLANASFEITELGQSVLRGEADFVSLNGIEMWMGGVHLDGLESLWRWDQRSERIVSQ